MEVLTYKLMSLKEYLAVAVKSSKDFSVTLVKLCEPPLILVPVG